MIKIGKKIKRFFVSKNHKYINGSKGVISIFLACMLVPFAYIADLLVESGRYNSSMAIVDQSIANAEVSTLADYDEYLLERFGLMAISQEKPIDALFKSYHDKCVKDLSESLEISDVAAEGLLALTNDEVLTRQIAEAGKYSIPAYFAGTTLSDLISKIEGLTKLDGIMGMLTDAGDMADAYVVFADELIALKTAAGTLTTDRDNYNKAFDEFRTAVNNLAAKYSELEAAEKTLTSAKSSKTTADNNFNSAVATANQSKNILVTYRDSLSDGDEKTKLSNLIGEIEKYISNPTSSNWNSVTKAADKKVGETKVSDIDMPMIENGVNITYKVNSMLISIENCGLIGKKSSCDSANSSVSSAQSEYNKIQEKIAPLQSTVDTEKGEYNTAITKVSGSLGDFNTQLAKVKTAKDNVLSTSEDIAKSAAENIVKSKDQDLKDWDEEKKALEEKKKSETDDTKKAELDTQIKDVQTKIDGRNSEYDNAKLAAENMDEMTDNAFENSYTSDFFEAAENYNELIIKAVSSLEAVGGNVSALNAYGKVSNISDRSSNHSYYYNVDNCFSTEAYIQQVIEEFEESLTDDGSSDSGPFAQLKGIFETLKAMVKSGGIYNTDLNSFVQSTGDFSESAIDGVLGSMAKLTNSVIGLAGLNFSNFFTKIKAVIDDGINFLKSLVTYLEETVERIVASTKELFTGKIGDRLLLSQYITMALPDRTTYDDGSCAITGMSYSDIARDDSGSLGIPVLSTIDDIITIFKGYVEETGNDPVFSGAEIEYILMGSKSEVVNQIGTFFQIYFIRMLFDIAPIMMNQFVNQLATTVGSASFGIGSAVVYVAYIIVEPFIDTTLIVGGNAMPLIKYTNDVYLTPTGLPELLKDLTGFAMSEAAKNELKEAGKKLTKEKEIKKNPGTPKKVDVKKKKSLNLNVDVDYTTYCFMLILFSNDTGTTLTRLRNLITLEANAYYATKDQTFELAKTYTYIKGTVNADFSPILPLEPMSATAFNKISSTQYRGY